MRSDVSSTKKGRINIMDLITQLAIDLDAFLYDYDTYRDMIMHKTIG